MKQIALIILIAFGLTSQNSYAQKFKFEEYTADKKIYAQVVGANVIIEKEGSAEDLYRLTKEWILETYNNPEEVIIAYSEGQYIKIQGSGINMYSHMGFYFNSDKYRLSFKFKDGRLKMEIESASGYMSGSATRVGSSVFTTPSNWIDITDVAYKKTNGTVKKDGSKKLRSISSYFNGLAISLINYESSNMIAENEDW